MIQTDRHHACPKFLTEYHLTGEHLARVELKGSLSQEDSTIIRGRKSTGKGTHTILEKLGLSPNRFKTKALTSDAIFIAPYVLCAKSRTKFVE